MCIRRYVQFMSCIYWVVKRFFPFICYFLLQQCTLYRGTIRLLLLVRGQESPIIAFLNLYVALNRINEPLEKLCSRSAVSLIDNNGRRLA